MTINTIAKHLYDISTGHINGEEFTEKSLSKAIRSWMQDCENNLVKNTHFITVECNDGTFWCKLIKFSDTPDGYDYVLPADRNENDKIYNEFKNSYE